LRTWDFDPLFHEVDVFSDLMVALANSNQLMRPGNQQEMRKFLDFCRQHLVVQQPFAVVSPMVIGSLLTHEVTPPCVHVVRLTELAYAHCPAEVGEASTPEVSFFEDQWVAYMQRHLRQSAFNYQGLSRLVIQWQDLLQQSRPRADCKSVEEAEQSAAVTRRLALLHMREVCMPDDLSTICARLWQLHDLAQREAHPPKFYDPAVELLVSAVTWRLGRLLTATQTETLSWCVAALLPTEAQIASAVLSRGVLEGQFNVQQKLGGGVRAPAGTAHNQRTAAPVSTRTRRDARDVVNLGEGLKRRPFLHPSRCERDRWYTVLVLAPLLLSLLQKAGAAPLLHRYASLLERTSSASAPPLHPVDTRAPGRTLFVDLVHSHPSLWLVLAAWAVGLQRCDYRNSALVDELRSCTKLAELALTQLVDDVHRERISLAAVQASRTCTASALRHALELRGAPDLENALMRLDSNFSSQRELLRQLVALDARLSLSERQLIDAQVATAEEHWMSMPIAELKTLLRQREVAASPTATADAAELAPTPSVGAVGALRPLSQVLLDALPWLWELRECNTFALLWQRCEEQGDALLYAASERWRALEVQLADHSLVFGRARPLLGALSHLSECVLLVRTAVCYRSGERRWSAPPDLELTPDREQVAHRSVALVRRLAHVAALHGAQAEVRRVLACVPHWLTEQNEPHASVCAAVAALDSLSDLLRERPLAEWCAGDVDEVLWPVAERIAPSLVSTTPALMEALAECGELVRWLAQFADEDEFSNIIEMCMGKSEMECPSELWKQEPGRPGRPDEEVLSQLSSVRAFLHPLLYGAGVPHFADLPALAAALQRLRPCEQSLLDSLQLCAQLCTALSNLLSDDFSAADFRLAQLAEPALRARWRCSNLHRYEDTRSRAEAARHLDALAITDDTLDEEERQVWLVWLESATDGAGLPKTQRLDELLDFQSSMVLSTAGGAAGAPHMELSVHRFISQLALLRELNSAASRLQTASHFAYLRFDFSFEFTVSPATLRSQLATLRLRQRHWDQLKVDCQRRYYHLNHFSLTLLYRALCLLGAAQHRPLGEAHRRELLALLALVNAQQALEQSHADLFVERLLEAWRQQDVRVPAEWLRDQQLQEHGDEKVDEEQEVEVEEVEREKNGGADASVACAPAQAVAQVSFSLRNAAVAFDVVAARGRTTAAISTERAVVDTAADVSLADQQWAAAPDPYEETTVSALLHALGAALESAFESVPPSWRAVEVPALRELPILHSDLPIRAVCVESPSEVYEQVVFAYAHRGRLPERSDLLLCRQDTTRDEVTRMLNRWEYAASNAHYCERLFCVAGCEQLGYEVQRRAALHIRLALQRGVHTSLLILNVSSSAIASASDHLISQLSVFRTNIAVGWRKHKHKQTTNRGGRVT
jgi:hypothetical protein